MTTNPERTNQVYPEKAAAQLDQLRLSQSNSSKRVMLCDKRDRVSLCEKQEVEIVIALIQEESRIITSLIRKLH